PAPRHTADLVALRRRVLGRLLARPDRVPHHLPAPASPFSYTLPLHDALPIFTMEYPASVILSMSNSTSRSPALTMSPWLIWVSKDRESARLNSSHASTSYAVLCFKNKGRDPHRTDRAATQQPAPAANGGRRQP